MTSQLETLKAGDLVTRLLTQEDLDAHRLAKRAIACDGWRWMRGMRTAISWGCARLPWKPGDPVVEVKPTTVTWVREGSPFGEFSRSDGAHGVGNLDLYGHDPLPDLDDPATVGCLLALVREHHDRPGLTTMCGDGGWRVQLKGATGTHPTEVAALVEALEATS